MGLTTDPEEARNSGRDPATGMQGKYVVLSDEERAKGFIRPVRLAYVHVGAPGPRFHRRDLTDEEKENHPEATCFEVYPEAMHPSLGRYWTEAQLAAVGRGCRTVTTMNRAIAETYARDPHFYGGTYCAGCRTHLDVGEHGEFVWEGTEERVGT